MTLKKTPMDDTYSLPPKTITVDLWKAVAIMLTAMLGSAGAGLWSGITTLNADHYQLVALAQEVSDHQVKSDEVLQGLMVRLSSIDSRLSRIEGRLEK
jgi:hypothetical protein